MSEDQHHAKKQPKITPATGIPRQNPARAKEYTWTSHFPFLISNTILLHLQVRFPTLQKCRRKENNPWAREKLWLFQLWINCIFKYWIHPVTSWKTQKDKLEVNKLFDWQDNFSFLWLLPSPPQSRNGGSSANQTQL